MNNDLVGIWKEGVVAYFTELFREFLGIMKEATKNSSRVEYWLPVEI
jgi:hypothetical protein